MLAPLFDRLLPSVSPRFLILLQNCDPAVGIWFAICTAAPPCVHAYRQPGKDHKRNELSVSIRRNAKSLLNVILPLSCRPVIRRHRSSQSSLFNIPTSDVLGAGSKYIEQISTHTFQNTPMEAGKAMDFRVCTGLVNVRGRPERYSVRTADGSAH